MRYILEFGVRGGAHTDNVIVDTRYLAEKLARQLVNVFMNDPCFTSKRDFLFSRHTVRFIWTSETHFVAVSKLDGVPRGSASAAAWRKPTSPELLSGTISEYFQ